MEPFNGNTLSWSLTAGVLELALHRDPCNEIGSATLEELERFADALESAGHRAQALIIYSRVTSGPRFMASFLEGDSS